MTALQIPSVFSKQIVIYWLCRRIAVLSIFCLMKSTDMHLLICFAAVLQWRMLRESQFGLSPALCSPAAPAWVGTELWWLGGLSVLELKWWALAILHKVHRTTEAKLRHFSSLGLWLEHKWEEFESLLIWTTGKLAALRFYFFTFFFLNSVKVCCVIWFSGCFFLGGGRSREESPAVNLFSKKAKRLGKIIFRVWIWQSWGYVVHKDNCV